jgi:hypothetical protein
MMWINNDPDFKNWLFALGTRRARNCLQTGTCRFYTRRQSIRCSFRRYARQMQACMWPRRKTLVAPCLPMSSSMWQVTTGHQSQE